MVAKIETLTLEVLVAFIFELFSLSDLGIVVALILHWYVARVGHCRKGLR
jgi:hypothetical protein